MTENKNDWTKELLSWHGHDRGGVHVPFQNVNPLGSTPIATGLIQRLRKLADDISIGNKETPRWIFLVGGPGNGKSETVQDFLSAVDEALHLQGTLISCLRKSFSPQPLVPRRVDVKPSDLNTPREFATKVGRLIIVQDATATDVALGNSAKQLVDDVLDLLTAPENPTPIFVACANRGLLARALKEAKLNNEGEDITTLFEELIKASSLGVETLVSEADRPSCWPLNGRPEVACWPLDLESLFVPYDDKASPIEQIFMSAVDFPRWGNYCESCSSKEICPFLQNAKWLREDVARNNLLKILRRGELLLGQRWNFRDAFSLAAEIIVGQWADFDNFDHPCSWVHAQASYLKKNPEDIIIGSLSLIRRLYPHALFSSPGGSAPGNEFIQLIKDHPITLSAFQAWEEVNISSLKSIRERLQKEYMGLDPASFTPKKTEHVLRLIENDFSQSIQQGNEKTIDMNMSGSEQQFMASLETAEREWHIDLMGRNAQVAARAIAHLKREATCVVKRSIGVRNGYHANEEYLEEFEKSLHEQSRLRSIVPTLLKLLGNDKFRFNILESFGQPQAEDKQISSERPIELVSELPGMRIFPASVGNQKVPSHDMPFFVISGTDYPVPLTFDFYFALRLRQEGCAGSSLPASVRAAVDRVKQQLAGRLCRDKGKFVDRTAKIIVLENVNIAIGDETAEPTLVSE